MKRAIIIATIVWSAIFAGLWSWSNRASTDGEPSPMEKLYSNKLQTAFFSGFLTLAGFILSLKTNILLRLQKDLFDDPVYKKRVENASVINGQPISRNAPLINLGNFLVWTVLICVGTALAQITLGLIATTWAVSACFAFVGASMVFILFSWYSIRINLCLWFDLLQKKEEEEAKDKQSAA